MANLKVQYNEDEQARLAVHQARSIENLQPQKSMTQKLRDFTEGIERGLSRLQAIQEAAIEDPASPDFIRAILQELQTHSEELHVAEEELWQQSEALASANREVEAERQHYLDLFELMPDAYLVTNAEGLILEANRAAHILLHRGQPYLVGKPLALFVASQERAAFRRKLLQLRQFAQIEVWETQVTPSKSKVPLDVMLTVASTHEDNGVILRWLVRDQTEAKRTQTALRQSYDELDLRVQERTAELARANAALKSEILERQRIEEVLRLREEHLRFAQKGANAGSWEWHIGGGKLVWSPECFELHHMSANAMTPTFDQWMASIYPDDRESVQAAFDAIVDKRQTTMQVEYRICHPSGEERWLTAIGQTAIDEGKSPPRVTGLSIDITDRKRTEIKEHDQRVLAEALVDTAAAVNSTLDLPQVLDRILVNVGHVVPHDAASIMLIDSGMAQVALVHQDSGQNILRYAENKSFDITETPVLLKIYESQQPVIVPCIPQNADGVGEHSFLPSGFSYIGMPMLARNKIVGFLNLLSATSGFFTPIHQERLQAFVEQAANAIHNALLYEQAHHLAAFQERQRLARDLHDAVSQSLFTSSLVAETLPTLLKQDSADFSKHLEYLYRLNRGALAEMRALLMELRPGYLAEADLRTLLGQLIDGIKGRKMVDVRFSTVGTEPILSEISASFYRIAQEALNNVVRHAHAAHISVSLRSVRKGVELRIQDDGTGFSTRKPSAGMGLDTMHERASAIGAAFRLRSKVGKGTLIRVYWQRDKQGNGHDSNRND